MTKCQAALHTLQAFPFFRPTCLCREPHVDPDCNSFQNFLFDHPCIYVLKKGKFNARGPIIFLYITSKTFANTLFISFKLPSQTRLPKIHGKNWYKFFFEIHEKKKISSRLYHIDLYSINRTILFDFLHFHIFQFAIIRNLSASIYICICNIYRVVEFFPRRKIGFIGGNRENQLRSI